MTTLVLDSERFPPSGAIAGAGLQRLLGAPSLDLLQTVVREAVQNSVDATRKGSEPGVIFRCRSLDRREVSAMSEKVFASLPPSGTSADKIREYLERDSLTVLEVCDYGTSGLGGPTRADRMPSGTTTTNFIDFLRNVGAERNTNQGGGTYGYGKVSLYRASQCSTIIVDTRTTESGASARRLMACHLGSSFDKSERGEIVRYTGRHWWGANKVQGCVDPLEGQDALRLSKALGFPDRSNTDTGTSIMILDPVTDSEAVDHFATAKSIVDTLLWNYWPRMMKGLPPSKFVTFKVYAGDQEVPVPDPESYPPLELYCQAMRNLADKTGDTREIPWGKGGRTMGHVSLCKGLWLDRPYDPGEAPSPRKRSSHIALMRPVDFVVKYLEGMPFSNQNVEWAGVFRASDEDEVERAFADAEPPAHDDWMPDSIPDRTKKSWVNATVSKLKALANTYATEGQSTVIGQGRATPLGELAQRLGSILPGGFGEGAGPKLPQSETGGGGKKRLSRVSQPTFERLQHSKTGPVAWFRTEFSAIASSSSAYIHFLPGLASEGGALEGGDDAGLEMPKVLRIEEPGRPPLNGTDQLRPDSAAGYCLVAVSMPAQCAVTLKATLVDGAGK